MKRLNDSFEENAKKLIEQGKSKSEAYENKRRHYFFVPKEARWPVLVSAAENIGEKIDHVCRIIERENPDLDGVLTNTKYNDKRKYSDDKLRKLISHFNSPRLRNEDLESTDIFGDAFEYLLEQFAVAFPFSMDWDNKNAARDPYNRFRFGILPSQDKADFAFIQHMFASLNQNGQAAIICSQGVLFRGNEEENIRRNMINEDIIEGIVALPPKLFYGTGIPGCVLILNREKPSKRKNRIIFIYAARDYEEGKVRNKLREEDINKSIRCSLSSLLHRKEEPHKS